MSMTSKSRFSFSDLVVDRYLWTAALAFLAIVVLAAGLQHLITVQVGVRNHFSADDPHLLKLEEFEQTYAVSDSVLVIVAPPNDTIFTRDALISIEQLTETLWQTPYSVRVDSITNYVHTRGTEDSLIVEQLVDDAALLDGAQIDRIQQIALTAQETVGRFVSRDGRLAGLIVSLSIPDEGRKQKKVEVVEAIHDLVNKQRAANPDVAYHIYGELLLNQAVRDALDADMSVLAPIAFAMMILVAFVLLRSVWLVCSLLVMLVAVIVSSFGFAGWFGIKFYAESGAALFVLMAIAAAHSVHLAQGMMDGMLHGMKRTAAIVYSLQINVRPIFLTSFTTMIGFLSLNFSEMPPFRVMGNIVAFGAMCAFVYAVTLLPALLAMMPIRNPPNRKSRVDPFVHLGRFVVSRSNVLLWAFAIVSVVSAIGVSRIELNDNNNANLLDDSYELRRSGDFINENFSGLDTFEYSLSSGREEGITDITYLRQVEAFASWLREQPEVSHVTSITDIMKRLNQNLHNQEIGSYALPKNSDLAVQYLLLYEFSLPVGSDLNNLMNFERSSTRMIVMVKEMSVKEQIALDKRATAWLKKNAPQMQTGATGVTIVGAYSVMRNIVNMLIGTIVAMLIVSLLLIIAFRSLRFGLLSLVPNFRLPELIQFAMTQISGSRRWRSSCRPS